MVADGVNDAAHWPRPISAREGPGTAVAIGAGDLIWVRGDLRIAAAAAPTLLAQTCRRLDPPAAPEKTGQLTGATRTISGPR